MGNSARDFAAKPKYGGGIIGGKIYMGGPGSGGHNRKTVAVKEIEGNPGKRPLVRLEPESGGALPTCPGWLDPEAKREWRRVCRELGNLTKKDRAVLAGYCSAYARWRKAEESLNEEGLTQEARHGDAPRPEVKIAVDALTQMKAFAVELGLTPRSRVGKTPGKPKTPKDPLDEALGTRRMN